jgi:hypothetical protein
VRLVRWPVVTLGAAAFSLSLMRPAIASDASFVLDWDAPASCPDGEDVRATAIRLAGNDVRAAHRLMVRVRVARADPPRADPPASGWSLHMVTDLDGLTGERRLTGGSCEALARVVIVTLALIMNPEADLRSAPLDVASASEPPPAKPVVWFLGARGGLDVGIRNRPAGDVGIELGAFFGRGQASLALEVWPPRDDHVTAGTGGHVWGGAAMAIGCGSLWDGPVALAPCAGVEVDWLDGRGFGIGSPRQGAIAWPDIAFGADLTVNVTRLIAARFAAFGLVPLARPELFLEGIGTIDRPSAVAGRFSAGIVFLLR